LRVLYKLGVRLCSHGDMSLHALFYVLLIHHFGYAILEEVLRVKNFGRHTRLDRTDTVDLSSLGIVDKRGFDRIIPRKISGLRWHNALDLRLNGLLILRLGRCL
jgi:hypothetical protein